MCELFGVSSSTRRDYPRWLIPFRVRGGEAADNPDGWGIAYWADDKPVIEKSPEPGWDSVRFLEMARSVQTSLVLAHVRKARHPPIPGLLNTHPFAHACCGRDWVFAHNGLVPAVVDWTGGVPVCHPEGETDSESAFCHLLAGIARDYDASDHRQWLARLTDIAEAIAATGKFNFLMSDGRFLIAYGHDHLHYAEQGGDGDALALIATEPLSDDAWHSFAPGELRVYRDGALLARHNPP